MSKKVELVSIRSISKNDKNDVWQDMFKIKIKVGGELITLKDSLKNHSVESFVKSKYPESEFNYISFIYEYGRPKKIKSKIYGEKRHACNR